LFNDPQYFEQSEDVMEALVASINKSKACSLNDICLSSVDLIFLFEYRRIAKMGSVISPYAYIEWHGVEISQVLLAICVDTSPRTAFLNEEGNYDQTVIHFYDRNPIGRELDFDESLGRKEDFLRYAVQLTCNNPIENIIHTPLPPLENLARGAAIQREVVVTRGVRTQGVRQSTCIPTSHHHIHTTTN
jgi:hypothetical protein